MTGLLVTSLLESAIRGSLSLYLYLQADARVPLVTGLEALSPTQVRANPNPDPNPDPNPNPSPNPNPEPNSNPNPDPNPNVG